MSDYCIRFVALEGRYYRRDRLPNPGAYLQYYFPNANDGDGWAHWTSDKSQALRFPDAAAALRLYNTIPDRRKRRRDGKPNKPLTAFTVSIERLEE